MRFLLVTTAFLILSFSQAQQGDFLLTHHFPQNSNIDNSNFEIISDSYGRLCIANRSGVLKYDGEAWDYYKTPSAALSIAVDSSDVVYVGCIGSIGKIDFHERKIQYQEILETDTIDDLFLQTHYLGGNAYFLGSNNLITYNIETEQVKHYRGNFINMYSLDDEMIVNTNEETLVIGDSLSPITPGKKIVYSSKRQGKPDLTLGFDQRMYSYQENKFSPLPQNRFLDDTGFEIKEIQWVNDSLFACSTFENGIILFNEKDPKYAEVTNYNSGLPDNEVYTFHADNTNGIWVAHQFGITQIAPLFPAYSYSQFRGLNGKLTSVYSHKKDLWVTTSLGLFYFDSDTIFENQVYYELKEKKRKSPPQSTQKSSNSNNESKGLKSLFGKKRRAQGTQPKKKKGLLNSISDIFDNETIEKIKGKLDIGTKYVRKVRKVPIDINYAFRQVEGANGKFLSVLPFKNKILGIGSNGIYELTKDGAHLIISESIRSYMVNRSNQLVISTSDLALKVFILSDEIWIERNSLSMNDIIVSMQEDESGSMWMAGSSSIYKTSSTDSTFTIDQTFDLNNKFLDEVSILNRNDTLYFINSEGYYFYDKTSDNVLEDASIKASIGLPLHHLFDPAENGVWIFNGKVWSHLKEDGSIEDLEYLGLFPDLRAISIDQSSNQLWLITESNEILKYNPAKAGGMESFNFFLRKVSNEGGELDHSKKFTLSYDENFLNIELSKPDFLGLLNPEFQYKLNGLHNDWSEWARSKSIDFSFLPEGNYSLQIRARDAFGRIEEGEVMSFSVKPPYWQTPWFYAIQILFFGGLVYYSTKLNQDSSKNRLLRSGLTLLTLVLIIEFLQSAIGSLFSFKSTPVVDFLLDASIAFMIFPLERLLRELMTQGKVKVKINKENIPLVRKDSSSK